MCLSTLFYIFETDGPNWQCSLNNPLTLDIVTNYAELRFENMTYYTIGDFRCSQLFSAEVNISITFLGV